MISRDFISGFFMGFGISSICHGLYLMYVGNKLIKLSKIVELTSVSDDDIDIDINSDNSDANVD